MEPIKVSEERIAVLIGEHGRTKKEIEKRGKMKLKINSEGIAEIASNDPLKEWEGREVVKAIARGFSPEKAFKLFKENIYLKVINLRDLFGSDNEMRRIKGRIIGEKGKCRRVIEDISEVSLCVYGDTVALIGGTEELALAEGAINKIMEGAPHCKVYTYLERGRRKMKESRMELWRGALHQDE
ncbi:MAG: KH domain-containing protein [Candidatus Micrarchaeota archaeon]